MKTGLGTICDENAYSFFILICCIVCTISTTRMNALQTLLSCIVCTISTTPMNALQTLLSQCSQFYTKCYCEENTYRLLSLIKPIYASSWAVFVSNDSKMVPFWQQKSAPSPNAHVIWDYHVFCIVQMPDMTCAFLKNSRIVDTGSLIKIQRLIFLAVSTLISRTPSVPKSNSNQSLNGTRFLFFEI